MPTDVQRSFSDEELEKLSSDIDPLDDFSGVQVRIVKLILERLDKAEKVMGYANHTYHCAALTQEGQCKCGYDRAYAKFKKVAGQ